MSGSAGRPVIVALGSNLGDREAALRDAVRLIGEIDGVRVTAASDIVQSTALTTHGLDEAAPSYLNAVIALSVDLTLFDLLDRLNEIERDLGRVRAERWGDRTIDLDIIAAGSERIETDRLTVPHPGAATRTFVLVPWLQVEPGAVLPGAGTVAELAARASELQPNDGVEVFAAEPLVVGAAT